MEAGIKLDILRARGNTSSRPGRISVQDDGTPQVSVSLLGKVQDKEEFRDVNLT
jgi:hypothetical protein